ncbi:hypothetical protein [Methanolapillus ohkumae]|uniref:Uncharacterized protein n=1 Tax=Methanolapillus ohkumae TaxID=3028298 RepID=A0AA96V701_9EURY|nr:hypothetical protein MsAm2_10750 [Methanosarcinaceae archaeon Am2]
MDFNTKIIEDGLKKAWGAYIENIVALIIGLLIAWIGSILIVTTAPLMYGLYYMCVKASRGEKVEIKDVFYGFSSVSMFIRSWIYFLVLFVIVFAIIIIVSIVSYISAILGMLVYFILLIIFAFAVYYSMAIYVMSPKENVIYALKEGFEISKSNLLVTIVVMILAGIISMFVITAPLAFIFDVYVLKELKPTIKDES